MLLETKKSTFTIVPTLHDNKALKMDRSSNPPYYCSSNWNIKKRNLTHPKSEIVIINKKFTKSANNLAS